jgi:hypothetical protein
MNNYQLISDRAFFDDFDHVAALGDRTDWNLL